LYSSILNAKLEPNSLHSCYFFHGEEPFLAEQFIKELEGILFSSKEEGANFERFDTSENSWRDIIDTARTIPVFFTSGRLISVELSGGESDSLGPGDQGILKDYLTSSAASQSVLVLFYPGKLKKSSSLFRFFSGLPSSTVLTKEVKPLKGQSLIKWAEKRFQSSGKGITGDALNRLVELTGNDLRRLDSEIEKIVIYVDDKGAVDLDDVNDVSGWVRSFVEWEISDSLERADFKHCLVVLDNLMKKEGVSPLALLGLTVKFFREVFMAKIWLHEKQKTRKDIFRIFKPQIQEKFQNLYRTKFQQFFELVDALSLDELTGLLAELEAVDLRFKTSTLSFQALMEGFLFEYCSLRGPSAPRSRSSTTR